MIPIYFSLAVLSVIPAQIATTVPQQEVITYVHELAAEMDLDANLALAILKAENPELQWHYVNVNTNKTADIGLWQLNSRYLWSDFVPRYWTNSNVLFNPYDWKHSTYLAMRHIQYLQIELANFNKVILAYNCGISAVKKNKVPDSARNYLRYVIKQYRKLQKQRAIEIAQNS